MKRNKTNRRKTFQRDLWEMVKRYPQDILLQFDEGLYRYAVNFFIDEWACGVITLEVLYATENRMDCSRMMRKILTSDDEDE